MENELVKLKTGYNDIQIKGNQVLQTWLFAVVHDIIWDGISIYFVYLIQIVAICFSEATTDTACCLLLWQSPGKHRTEGNQTVLLPGYRKHPIRLGFFYNSFFLCFNMQKKKKENAIHFNINRYDFYCHLCHKRFSYIIKPYNSEHHELLKPSQQSYSMKGTYILGVPQGAFTDYDLKC